MPTLSHAQAQRFYDRFGSKQDKQVIYEEAPLKFLAAHLELAGAESILEFGCGTGRMAQEWLKGPLPESARYVGVDSSATMLDLSRKRLEPFGQRARLERTDGEPSLPVEDGAADRVASAYVLDLLAEEDIEDFLAEAHRVLSPRGLLGLAGLSTGCGPVSRLVAKAWSLVHAIAPAKLGGCRPMELLPFLETNRWEVQHHVCLAPWGIASEVVIARKRS